MLNQFTTRARTPSEDAEQWPGGTARPVLAYLVGMAGAEADELLAAARAEQARSGPARSSTTPSEAAASTC